MKVYNIEELDSFRVGSVVMLVKILGIDEDSLKIQEKIECRIDENNEENLILRTLEEKEIRVYDTNTYTTISKDIFNLGKKEGKGVGSHFLKHKYALWVTNKRPEYEYLVIQKPLSKLTFITRNFMLGREKCK